MLTLLRLIILRNWRSVLTLIIVTIFSGIGFITLGQLTKNIETSVARETRPLFGADMIISVDGYTGSSLYDTFASYLSGETYVWAERYEFSTTLFDKSGQTGLVKVVAYDGSYPQRGVLKTEVISGANNEIGIKATKELIERFSTGGVISLDEKNVTITETILESSDLGFSLGTENHLLILPASYLSGSLLLSQGSRLDHELLISFTDEKRAGTIKKSLNKLFPGETYRIRTYEERSNQALEIVDELSSYILLILIVSSIFALVILRSAHDTFFDNLSQILRIIQILGFNRERQKLLFSILYIFIIPVSLIIAGILGYLILLIIAMFPEAKDFEWYFSSFFNSLLLLFLLIFGAFFPAWRERWFNVGKIAKYKIFQSQNSLNIIIGIIVIYIIFQDIVFATLVVLGGGILLVLLTKVFGWIYEKIFSLIQSKRETHFLWYDGIRTLVRPLTPTIPITISLVSVTTFFLVFTLFSFSFYQELTLDVKKGINMYALNILESDKEKIEKVLTDSEMYSILRARITRINNKPLAEHLKTERPSGEFTREFNITTSSLENEVILGSNTLLADEVSIDEEFAKRLRVTIGDTVNFLLSGKNITLKIANIRESTRQGFRPFFYFSLNPDAFRTAPKTYFVSTYTSDKEKWKRLILNNSGPHVTFIDVENILSIVRDISSKIIAVIGLFLGVVGIFGFFAILSFFGRMQIVESMKKRLYTIFGLLPSKITTSLNVSRMSIFIVSGIFSFILALVMVSSILYKSSILSLSGVSVGIISVFLIIFYSIFILILKVKK